MVEKKEKFQYILQLQDYQEMKNAVKLIMSTDELKENDRINIRFINSSADVKISDIVRKEERNEF